MAVYVAYSKPVAVKPKNLRPGKNDVVVFFEGSVDDVPDPRVHITLTIDRKADVVFCNGEKEMGWDEPFTKEVEKYKHEACLMVNSPGKPTPCGLTIHVKNSNGEEWEDTTILLY